MTVNEVQKAIAILTALLNKAAQKVVDCTAADVCDKAPDGKPFDFFGFQARSAAVQAQQATVEAQIEYLMEQFQNAIQDQFRGPTIIYWREYPGLLLGANSVRIGCKARFAPTIAMVKTAPLVTAVNGGTRH